MDWHAPAPWMRDYILAMRAVWDCWQNGTELNFESDHYNLNLMVPLFNPGPIEHPTIPVHVAAIGPNMVAMAGEVADGVRLHPVCTPRFIDEEVHPQVARGAARTGRDADEVEVCMKPLVGTAATEEALARVTDTVRARVAFYLSTPSYRRTFELHGWSDIAEQASRLSKQQDWDALPGLVHDDMLHAVATLGTHETIGAQLVERYGSRVDRIEFSMPVNSPAEAETYRGILGELRAD